MHKFSKAAETDWRQVAEGESRVQFEFQNQVKN